MFSSTTNPTSIITSLNNMSPFPQYYFPSSSSLNYLLQPQSPLSSLALNQEHDVFLHQNHSYDPTVLLANNSPQSVPETALVGFGVSSCDAVISGVAESPAAPILRKKPASAAKKDRHSKIYTAQGLRDRRVRLSIEIAREFFDLHDMLGFDKASKTLEWLMNKSGKAIKELARTANMKPRASKTSLSRTNSECDQAVSEVAELGQSNGVADGREDQPDQSAPSKSNNAVSDEASPVDLVAAKESRAKARARARARTKEKRYKCNASHSKKAVEKCGSSSQISTQLSSWMINHHQPIFGTLAEDSNYQETTCPLGLFNDDNHNVDTKRKYLKFPLISSTNYYDDHDRNGNQLREFFAISEGENSNNNNAIYSPSSSSSLLLPPNWDINCTELSKRPSFG